MNENKGTFNFDNEIVIGVNKVKDDKKNTNNNYKKKNTKGKKLNAKNKKKKASKKVIKIFAIVIIFAIIIIFGLTAPIFNITDIKVQGNNTIKQETIISLSGLKKGENIFKFNNQVISKIEENTYIDKVEIKRQLPGTVIINIEERQIKYQINLINSYAYIDKNGYILENSTIKKEVPTILGLKITENELINKKRLENIDLEKLNDISKIVDSAKNINIDTLITEINAEDEKNYNLYLESKLKRIYIGDTSNLTNKMLYVKKILENEEGKSGIAFVNGDIRSGFKPYFREE